MPVFPKAGAKLLLFFELTKYFRKKMQLKMHFVCNTLKINDRIFGGKIGAVGGRFEARFLPLVAVSLL